MRVVISFNSKNGIKFSTQDIKTLDSDLEKLTKIEPIQPDNDFKTVYGSQEFIISEREIIVSKNGSSDFK